MKLKTMEAMGYSEAEILKSLKGQLDEAKKTVEELKRKIKLEADDRLLRQELYKTQVLVKKLEDEIFKRKYIST